MKTKVCVIGAGLAGGIVASALAAKGHSVTLAELGNDPLPYNPKDEVWEAATIKAPFTRGTGLGGTSNFWHGGLTVLDRTDIEGVCGVDPMPRMPISYEELRSYYEKALHVIGQDTALVLQDIESRGMHRGGELGDDGKVFRHKSLVYPKRPFSTRGLIEYAERNHGLQVVRRLRIRRLVGSSNRTICRADGIDVVTGALRSLRADCFVLASGGLGSPKILLESVSGLKSLEGLPIGNFLIDHPTGYVLKARLRRRLDLQRLLEESQDRYKRRLGFVLRSEELRIADNRNHILYLRPALTMKDPGSYDNLRRRFVTSRGKSLSLSDVLGAVRHPDLMFDAVNFRYGVSHSTRCVSGLIFAEQSPVRDNALRMRNDGTFAVTWNVSQEDSSSIAKFVNMFGECYSDVFERFVTFPDAKARLDSAGHHSGGCRMAQSAKEGVVDADLRVYGTDNLYVADASVLAYSGHANTGLTIVALALKCGEVVDRS